MLDLKAIDLPMLENRIIPGLEFTIQDPGMERPLLGWMPSSS
jgi:hypothetical protein